MRGSATERVATSCIIAKVTVLTAPVHNIRFNSGLQGFCSLFFDFLEENVFSFFYYFLQ
ncbi:hypothetical protein STRINF_00403 [Streptococcus infantarius subsp. infantarius ATCC BAA-102]|uniref:Uncharacterized protein n=1 Tax=Streptococcus infantarius subsp. infantarius ATCC BAA-102 TaxID=471872 RepID=A0ABM9XGE6_9STRE|nr:hypothetical protein STRINF_00403 [Streptococcus infantarius subsp. infantarius ATCC BAA-102]